MFKRILKILGICLAILVVVCGVSVGIYALQGGFSEKVINIRQIFIDDKELNSKDIYTLEDIDVKLNFEPLDATNRLLEVIVDDPLSRVENGVKVSDGVLKDVPKTVMAGETFTLKINKDSKGNNYGGVVTLTFRPANDSKSITDFTLKAIVDVAIPDNTLYFAGNTTDKYTTLGKSITMGISNNEQYVYLKSELVNAFYLQANNQNLKSAKISYDYYDLNKELIESKTFSDLSVGSTWNNTTKQYNYFYKVPVTPKYSGSIKINAQMHRTHQIESDYIAGDFDNMPTNSITIDARNKIDRYNEFINRYIKYFDTTEESYNFFKPYLDDNGKVSLPLNQIEKSKSYVYQTCSTTINITAVNLKDITSTIEAKTHKVMTSTKYSLKEVIREFDLDIELDQDNVANSDIEKDNLFDTLKMTPYLYLSEAEFTKNVDYWKDYAIPNGTENPYFLAVTKFEIEGNKPSVDGIVHVELISNGDGSYQLEDYGVDSGVKGFLIILNKSDNEFMKITPSSNTSSKYWTIDFNVPLVDNGNSIDEVSKALYIKFDVKGMDLDKNIEIEKSTFCRFFIDYTEYSYREEMAKLSIDPLKDMIINTSVNNIDTAVYTSNLYRQNVNVSLPSKISNYNSVEYKNVMYFVERESNVEGSYSKVATVGKYNFKYMSAGTGESDEVKLGQELLVGERLLFSGKFNDSNPEYYLRAINASQDPVKIFAVVYLSDKNGNPIDANGRKIKIDESSNEPNTLVVFSITDISNMSEVKICNFVDNINFYTVASLTKSIDITEEIDGAEIRYTVEDGNYVKRNLVNTYVDENGLAFNEKLEDLQDLLTLKLLYKEDFDLYVTNFELTKDGSIDDKDTVLYLDIRDLYGKTIKVDEDNILNGYSVYTLGNKRQAFDYLCQHLNKYRLNIQATNGSENAVINSTILEDDNNQKFAIKYTLNAEGKTGNDGDVISLQLRTGVNDVISALSNTDVVNWRVNTLNIKTVNLLNEESQTLNQYKTLYAVNSDDANDDAMRFVYFEGENKDSKDYYLPKSDDDDNINRIVLTDIDEIADLSQSNYEKDLAEYYEKYINNINNSSFSYINPVGAMRLVQDIVFNSQGGNEYLYVGAGRYEIVSGGTPYVMIEGKQYTLTSDQNLGFTLTLNAGDYFPYINKGRDKIVLMLGQEFIVSTMMLNETEAMVISNTIDTGSFHQYARVQIIDSYNPNNYIRYNSNNSSSIKKVENDNNEVKLAVNFQNGGVEFYEDANGDYKFVEDDNGEYILNGNTGYYVLLNESEKVNPNLVKYSMQGIKAFLIVQFRAFNGQTFNKILTYELIEEPIVLVVSDNNGESFTLSTNQNNDKQIYIPAGAETTINFETKQDLNFEKGKGIYINLINISNNIQFFKHCEFEYGSTKGQCDKYVKDGNIITITTEKMYSDDSSQLKITYKYAGHTVTKILNIMVKADYSFTFNQPNIPGFVSNEYYLLRLPKGSTTNIMDYITVEKEGSNDKNTVKFSFRDGATSPYAEINGTEVTLANVSYALVDPNATIGSSTLSVIRDYFDLEITLKKSSEDIGIKLEKYLRIEIEPQYTFDLRALTQSNSESNPSISLLGGQSLYNENFIKIYNGASYTDIASNSENIAKGIFTFKYWNNADSNWVEIENGIIPNTWSINQTYKILMTYTEGTSNISSEFYIKVVGYEVYFSETYDLGLDTLTYEDVKANASVLGNESKTLTFEEGSTLNMDKLFRVYVIDNAGVNLSEDIHIVLLDESNNIIPEINALKLSDSKTYTLAVASYNNSNYSILKNLNIEIELQINAID